MCNTKEIRDGRYLLLLELQLLFQVCIYKFVHLIAFAVMPPRRDERETVIQKHHTKVGLAPMKELFDILT